MLSEVYNIFILVLTLYRSFRRMSSDGYNFASVTFLSDVFMMAVGHGGRQHIPFFCDRQINLYYWRAFASATSFDID